MISRRNVIRNGQEGERPRASHGHPSLALLGRLLWRLVPTRFPRRNCAELFLYEGLDASLCQSPQWRLPRRFQARNAADRSREGHRASSCASRA